MRRMLPPVILTAAALAAAYAGPADSAGAGLDTERICAELARAATPIERRAIETDHIDAASGKGELGEVLLDMMDRCPDEAIGLLGDDRPPQPGPCCSSRLLEPPTSAGTTGAYTGRASFDVPNDEKLRCGFGAPNVDLCAADN